MSALVLDAGALIGIERRNRVVLRRLEAAEQAGIGFRTTAIVVAEVWRSPTGRQALLAKILNGTDIRSVDTEMARAAGLLLARSRLSNPIDATIVLVADDFDVILTSDPEDIATLAAAAVRRPLIVRC